MIKSRAQNGKVSVTFTLPSAVGARRAAVCGEWNNWSPYLDVMQPVEDGFAVTVPLEIGRTYRFRYLLDGYRWENDWGADAYVPNPHGSEDSLVDLRTLVEPEPGKVLAPAAGFELAERPGPSAEAVEKEAKLVAPAGLGIPDLAGLVPGATATRLPVRHLDATYYDTDDLRLARSGITLRHRGGEPGPAWTVKLPGSGQGSSLTRHEIRFDGPADQIPNPVADLVLASTRARALAPVARLTTVRRPVEIRDRSGQLLAEVVDDTVSVSNNGCAAARFREVEVESYVPGHSGRRLRDAAVSRLVDAGCLAEPPVPKLVRALGEPATRPPDVVVSSLGKQASLVDLVQHAIARSVAQIVRHDPGARLGLDAEDVHQLRVATRRLRSDLHSFGPLLRQARVVPVRTELRWLGGSIGAVRDKDVLGARLQVRLAALPHFDAAGVNRLMLRLEREAGEARSAMLTALRDARYLELLDTLVDFAAEPPFAKEAKIKQGRSPKKIAAKIAGKPWRRLKSAVDALGRNPSDAELHQIRILAKRSRYAADAVAPLVGPVASRFAAAVAGVQTVLGDHHDTVMAEEWLHSAAKADESVKPVANQLIALERSRRRELRDQWPATWRAASAQKLRSWL